MNSLLFGVIDRTVAFVRSLALRQVLVVALAGFLVLTSAACTPGVNARTVDNVDRDQQAYGASPYEKDTGATRELYKPTQKRQGGMNNYNDDLKYDRQDVKAEADKLVQRAEDNLNRHRVDNPGELFSNIKNHNPLGDKASESYRSTKDSAEKLASDFSAATRKGTRNVQQNLDKAGDNVPQVFNDAKRNAQGAADDVQEGAGAIVQGAKNLADRAGDAIQDRADDAASAVRDRL